MKRFAILLLLPLSMYANEYQPTHVGNFSLPVSQQPGPLVSFGQNIVNKGTVHFFLFADAFLGNHSYFTDVLPAILYGFTDRFSVFFNVPFSPGNQANGSHSSGMEDLILQFEYVFFNKITPNSVDLATIVFNTTFPTGSSKKNPPLGFGAPSFFVGTTYNHAAENWSIFFSPGVILPTWHKKTQFGNQFLYQAGAEGIIFSSLKQIFAWMVELDGFYIKKNRIDGKIDPDSGGNTIYLTPSLWYSTKKWIIQGGPSFPVFQHLNGNQPRDYIAFFLNIGYTI